MPTSRGLIEYATLGDGEEPAVLVIHGTPGGYDQGLMMALRIGPWSLHVIAPSRPGYLGTALDVGKTPRDQADAYADLLDALSISRAAIVALSGGGPSSIQFAAHHPERCAALVLDIGGRMQTDARRAPPALEVCSSRPSWARTLGTGCSCKSAETVDSAARHRLLAGRRVSTYQLLENSRAAELASRGARQ